MRFCFLREKSLSRAATIMLAASRLTSHSHGPGSVSSKSLTSNTRFRSGEANAPKFERCASPQHCTVRPRPRRGGEVVRHHRRRAPVEGERGDEHAAVADRHQLRHARGGLALEQLDRTGFSRLGVERRVGRERYPPSGVVAERDAIGDRAVAGRGGTGALGWGPALRAGHVAPESGRAPARAQRRGGVLSGSHPPFGPAARRRVAAYAGACVRCAAAIRSSTACSSPARISPIGSGSPLTIDSKKALRSW